MFRITIFHLINFHKHTLGYIVKYKFYTALYVVWVFFCVSPFQLFKLNVSNSENMLKRIIYSFQRVFTIKIFILLTIVYRKKYQLKILLTFKIQYFEVSVLLIF